HILIGIKRGVLTVCGGNLGPQPLGALAAMIPYMKGDHLVTPGIHGHPNPLLVRFLLYEASRFIRFHLESLHHHDSVTGHGLNGEMIGQCLEALDQKTHEPLEFDPHGTTNAPQRNLLEKRTTINARVSSEIRYGSKHSTNWRPQSWH